MKKMIRIIISLEPPQIEYLQKKKKETNRSHAINIRDLIHKKIE